MSALFRGRNNHQSLGETKNGDDRGEGEELPSNKRTKEST